MPLVAQLRGGIKIEQYYRDHNPPHFHAVCGNDEALIEIALPLKVYAGQLRPVILRDVRTWATTHRAALALNWIDALAQQPIQRIP